MFPIAQTNVQLFNQLWRAGWPPDDLALVRRAYGLAMRLYSGHFQADGKPFVSHSTGVASIVAHLGLPAELVATACVHNVYGNGDFGDGRERCITPHRRQLVRDAVGPEVEESICRFQELRLERSQIRIRELHQHPETLNARDRQLVVMDLADTLEQYANLGVLYYGENGWITGLVAECGDLLIEIAERLGYPQLGAALKEAFTTASLESVPAALRSEPDWKFLKLVVPLSCSLRPRLVARRKLSRLLRSARSMLGLVR